MEVTSTAANLAISKLTFGEGVLYAVLGMLVVFFALVLIMLIIKILIKATDKKKAEPAPAAAAPAPAEVPAEPVKRDDPAPGTSGDIKLYTTDPKEAAMIMAIVADALGKPLNELRFKSIREIKE
ncbi:MAG: OadG family protein [Firmicutes bacterium]|nr:OadG family protein [Bacillota bacterium]MBR6236702.1 OadG family protein [Bacillota bacterium]